MKKIANNVHHEALIVANFVVIIPGIAIKLEKLTQLFQVWMHVRSWRQETAFLVMNLTIIFGIQLMWKTF